MNLPLQQHNSQTVRSNSTLQQANNFIYEIDFFKSNLNNGSFAKSVQILDKENKCLQKQIHLLLSKRQELGDHLMMKDKKILELKIIAIFSI